MKLLAVAAIFVLGCYASCDNLQRDGEFLVATCVDEVTGFDFEYVDLNKTLEDSGVSEQDMPSAMYQFYLASAGPATAPNATTTGALDKRSIFYWADCSDQVAGRCDSEYDPEWSGGLRTYRQDTRLLLQQTQNGRSGRSPRSICTSFDQGTICVSWADYYKHNLRYTQVEDIAEECAETCEQQNQSCEARAVSYSETKYFCISNRARGCGAITLRNC